MDAMNEAFGTLSETINGLISLGYKHDFNIHDECLVCHQSNITLSPEDFQIDKVYRFEGASDPEDQSILYAISSLKFDIKGILVDGYGISSDEATSKLIEKLQTYKTPIVSENKTNEATQQRPENNRILNGQLVEMNLVDIMQQMKKEKSWIENDRNAVTIFKSDTMRIVLLGLHENAVLKDHKANGVISVQVLEGKVTFSTDQDDVVMNKGQMIALQENIVHKVVAIKECFFLLTLAMNSK